MRVWSTETFGPGDRTEGTIDHIKKELLEVCASRGAVDEWIDVVILALDGAWRCGHSPAQIVAALQEKQRVNEGREWPDWQNAEPGVAIEHVRDDGQAPVYWCGNCGTGRSVWFSKCQHCGSEAGCSLTFTPYGGD